MDERLIKDVLHDLAHREIPDDMKSLWPAIHGQLEDKRPRRAVRLTRLGWAAVIIALSLMIGAGAYAFYQSRSDGDPGLRQIKDKNLVTPIGKSVTIDGVTVTLDWAYADAQRISLAYTITGDETAGPDHLNNLWVGVLFDDQGHEMPPMFGGEGGDGGPQPVIEANANFDASAIRGEPDVLHLRFELTRDMNPAPDDLDGSGSAGGGGGSGGGGGEGPTGPTVMPPASGEPLGPFVFDFTVPFIPAVTVEPHETMVAGGVFMTLERIAHTPSMTSAQVCFTVSDQEKLWTPVASINTGSEIVERQGAGTQPSEDGRQCSELTFLAPYDRQPSNWTLTVERLEVPGQPTTDDLQAALAQYGVEIAVSPDGSWETTHIPDGVDIQTVMDEIYASFAEKIDGPWVFPLDVPGA